MKDVCEKKMTFNECELAILRNAVDKAEKKKGRRNVNTSEIKEIIEIVESFLKKKQLICYGGTAINNILPKQDQFYDKQIEIPDYDFYSHNALHDAKELADIYASKGFQEVEAKAGQHHGTYKVFVNFIPVADITYIPKELFNALKKESIKILGILYAPPNWLRMNMYLELSRPDGDISRWEKVLKRLSLLNKNFPLTSPKNCYKIDFQRKMSTDTRSNVIYDTVRNSFIDQGVVFFGGYAISLYSKYMPKKMSRKLENIPDFDVLSEEPEKCSRIVKERLESIGTKNISIVNHEKIGEIIPKHCEIRVAKETIAFIYEPLECHSYNNVNIDGRNIKIASLDTMLSLYLAFLYSNRPYYDENRILCMSEFLFRVQQKNRLSQRGILKRFSSECYGHQHTREAIRAEKTKKFHELKNKPKGKDWEWWFLKYRPGEKTTKKSSKQTKKKTSKKNRRKTKNRKRKNTRKRRNKKKKTRKRRKKFSFF